MSRKGSEKAAEIKGSRKKCQRHHDGGMAGSCQSPHPRRRTARMLLPAAHILKGPTINRQHTRNEMMPARLAADRGCFTLLAAQRRKQDPGRGRRSGGKTTCPPELSRRRHALPIAVAVSNLPSPSHKRKTSYREWKLRSWCGRTREPHRLPQLVQRRCVSGCDTGPPALQPAQRRSPHLLQ